MVSPLASFRDPAGSCRVLDERVLRVVAGVQAEEMEAFLITPAAQGFASRKRLVQTRRLAREEATMICKSENWREFQEAPASSVIFEHELIPFASYPYEWPAEMLWEAGRLTLELARASLDQGFNLKDATPYNVLFRGPEPVFIDATSFERRPADQSLWPAYGQFARTFLLPLLSYRRWGWRLADIFLTRRDGLEPHEVYALCSLRERFLPAVFSLVTMPTWLTGRAQARGTALYEPRKLANPEQAKFVIGALLKRLEKLLDSLKPRRGQASTWLGYMQRNSYDEAAMKTKETFVDRLLAEAKPKRLLDIGANTGHFSERAAHAGASVIAIDSDEPCMSLLWRKAREQKLDILPLVVDLARPSPALGWRNRECLPFLARATGKFDCVLMLAVVHHLLVTERIPLPEIFSLAAELTRQWLIVEFVPPGDRMFQELTRGRDHLHASLTQESFEAACGEFFSIQRSEPVPGTSRRLYILLKKGSC